MDIPRRDSRVASEVSAFGRGAAPKMKFGIENGKIQRIGPTLLRKQLEHFEHQVRTMPYLKKFKEDMFRAAQRPANWLLTAQRLRDGAEAILTHEQSFEVAYFQAHEAATQKAAAMAYGEGNDVGIANIEARVPNYPAAQLLYSYALENLLKGIWIAKDPSLISGDKLNGKLNSHDLDGLAKRAGFALHMQEAPVAKALSKLALWAGRYPVALLETEFAATSNADELLDFGSRHPVVKAMYERGRAELVALLPKPISNLHGAVVVFRQPGT